MHHSEQIDEIFAALAEAQASVKPPNKNREVSVKTKQGGTYKFKYATFDNIIEAVRGPMTGAGLWFTQTTEFVNDKWRLVTTVTHSSGQYIQSETPLLVQGQSNQEFGSALTYAKRYALCAILGIAADEDDDANIADGNTVESSTDTQKAARGYYTTKELRERGEWGGELDKTALKNKIQDLAAALRECADHDQVKALVEGDYAPVLAQAQEWAPKWYASAEKGIQKAYSELPERLEPEMPEYVVPVTTDENGTNWRAWHAKVADMIDRAGTLDLVNEIAAANQIPFGNYMKAEPEAAGGLKRIIENKRGFFAAEPVDAN